METKAVARYIRISPRKARLVVDTIRGRDLDAARQILDFSDKGAARVVGKVLRSAAANAENNNGIAPEDLFVARAFVDEGPTLKRFRPRAMGRATRINKRTCHITVILGEREPEKLSPRRKRRKKFEDAKVETEKAVTEKAAEQPVTEEAAKPLLEEPSAEATKEKATAKKSSEKKPGAKKPPAKKEVAKKPAAKKPAAKKAAKPEKKKSEE